MALFLLAGSTLLGYSTYAGAAFAACLAGYLGLQPGRELLKRTVVDKYWEMYPAKGAGRLIGWGIFSAWFGLLILAAAAFAREDLFRSFIAALAGQLVATSIVIAIAVISRRAEKLL